MIYLENLDGQKAKNNATFRNGCVLCCRNVNPALYLDTPHRQLSWLYLCFVNSWLLLNPFHLGADWRFGAVPLITSLTDLHNLLTILTLVAVTVLCIFAIKENKRRRKIALVGLALTLFPYLPASNLFFPVGFVVAERVLYLPSMGFCMLVGYGAWCMIQRMNKSAVTKCLLTLAITYLIAIHSLKTLVRNRSWHSSFTIYSSGVRFNPKNGVMLSNLGIEYAITKDYTRAELLYKTSVEVAPSYSRGFYNLGKLLKMMHRYHEAEEVIHTAVVTVILVQGAGYHGNFPHVPGIKLAHFSPPHTRAWGQKHC